MVRGRFIAYYRVSTDRQGRSGLGLDAQRTSVGEWLNGGRWELIAEFTEVETGKRSDRPQLVAALAACRKDRATLVIAKLDRLARNVHFISGLLESGVAFVAVDMPEADRTFLQMAAVFAEWEARKISERTTAALAVAKARGTRLGNPRLDAIRGRGAAVVRARADRFANNVLPVIASIQASGVTTLTGIAAALNARGVPTARGGRWAPQTIANAIARAEGGGAHGRLAGGTEG